MAVTEITSKASLFPDFREAWQHRRLVLVLVHRNVKGRYMQSLLGGGWIVLQPLLLVGIFTLIFGMLLSAPSDGMPYALFAFTGTVIWTGFQRSLSDTATSFASSGSIVLKVYFPRILIPVAATLTAAVDLIPIYILLLVLVVIFSQLSGVAILLSPAFLVLALLMGFALGLWATILDAVFRDIRLVIPSLLQFVLYTAPVMYSDSAVPERWQFLYRLNPLVGLVKGFRWSVAESTMPLPVGDIVWTCIFTAVAIVAGLMVFTRLETFAVDRI